MRLQRLVNYVCCTFGYNKELVPVYNNLKNNAKSRRFSNKKFSSKIEIGVWKICENRRS